MENIKFINVTDTAWHTGHASLLIDPVIKWLEHVD